jgi:hypothetical protein
LYPRGTVGVDEHEVACKLEAAGGCAIDWAAKSAAKFELSRTEAILLTRERMIDWKTRVNIRGRTLAFNQQARVVTGWLRSTRTNARELMALSALRSAVSLLNNRKWRYTLGGLPYHRVARRLTSSRRPAH